MGFDTQLSRLRDEQIDAFRRMRVADQVAKSAYLRRCQAEDALLRAYATQRSYATTQLAQLSLYGAYSDITRKMELLDREEERYLRKMEQAHSAASTAHRRGKRAAARKHFEEVSRYKNALQRDTSKRRQLDKKRGKLSNERILRKAKESFPHLGQRYDSFKAIHERAEAELQLLRIETARARKAFHDRATELQEQKTQLLNRSSLIAKEAGVPDYYLKDVIVKERPDGTKDIYFGGVDDPVGFGHAHYVLDPFGDVSYERKPFSRRWLLK